MYKSEFKKQLHEMHYICTHCLIAGELILLYWQGLDVFLLRYAKEHYAQAHSGLNKFPDFSLNIQCKSQLSTLKSDVDYLIKQTDHQSINFEELRMALNIIMDSRRLFQGFL